MSTGRYTRDIYAQRNRYREVLAQRSERGYPVYLTDADWNDQTRTHRAEVQQFARSFPNSLVGADAWHLSASAEANDFLILGGDNSDEGAKVAYVGGHRCLLYRDTRYLATDPATELFDPIRADEIHHRYTSVGINQLVDEHARYRVNALAGLQVRIGDSAEDLAADMPVFDVVSNTPTTLTLADFDPATLGTTHKFYYIVLTPPPVAADQDVYLDVHLEDWGMAEDPILNHNQGVELRPVECCRRMKLIQWVWVDQRTVTNPDNPLGQTTDYVDLAGAQHHVFRLGALPRAPDDGGEIAEPSVDGVEDQLSPQEVINARNFEGVCVTPDPTLRLKDRLRRGETFVTVGNETTNFGMFNKAQGIIDALACPSVYTVFVRRGTYDFAGLGMLTVPAGKRVIGEGLTTILQSDSEKTEGFKYFISGGRMEHCKLLRSEDGFADNLLGLALGASLIDCTVIDDAAAGEAIVVAAEGHREPVRIINCAVNKGGGNSAIRVTLTGLNTSASGDQGASSMSSDAVYGGVFVEGSHFSNSGYPEQDPIWPVVSAASGVFTTFSRCRISGGHRLLGVNGQYKSDAATAAGTYDGKDVAKFTHCLFTVERSNSLTTTTSILVEGGNAIFEQNVFDVVGVEHDGQMPAIWIDARSTSSPQMGRFIFRNNFMRGAHEAVRFTATLSQAECVISGNTFDPVSATLGNLYGVRVVGAALKGSLEICNNFIRASAETVAAIQLTGPADVHHNVLEGGASARVVEDQYGELSSAGMANGIDLALTTDFGGGAIKISHNRFHDWGGAAISCSTDGLGFGGADAFQILTEHNVIWGGLRGMSLSGSQPSCLLTCSGDVIQDTDREGIFLGVAGFCPRPSFMGVQFIGTGAAYVADAAGPETYAAFYGLGRLEGCHILDVVGPGVMYPPDAQGDLEVSNTRFVECGYTHLTCELPKASTVPQLFVRSCRFLQTTVLTTSLIRIDGFGRAILDGVELELGASPSAVFVQNCAEFALRNSSIQQASGCATAVRLVSTSASLDGVALQAGARVDPAILLLPGDTVAALTMRNCKVFGSGAAAVSATCESSGFVKLEHCTLQGGHSAYTWEAADEGDLPIVSRSVHLNMTDARAEIINCDISFGSRVSLSGTAALRADNSEFRYLGLWVKPASGSFANIQIQGCRFGPISPPNGDAHHVLDLTGLWVGTPGPGATLETVELLKVEGCHFNITGESSAFVPDAAADPVLGGYACGLAVQVHWSTVIRGNTFQGSNVGMDILLGKVNYQDSSAVDAANHRWGSRGPLLLANNAQLGSTLRPLFVGVGFADGQTKWLMSANTISLPGDWNAFYCMEEQASAVVADQVCVSPMGNMGASTAGAFFDSAPYFKHTPFDEGIRLVLPKGSVDGEAFNCLQFATFALP